MSDTKNVEWGWMLNGAEEAYGPFATREIAIEDAKQRMRDEEGLPYSVEILLGNCDHPEPENYIDLDSVLDMMRSAAEEYSYDGDSEIFEIDLEARAEEELEAWARKYVKPVAWILMETEKLVISEEAPHV